MKTKILLMVCAVVFCYGCTKEVEPEKPVTKASVYNHIYLSGGCIYSTLPIQRDLTVTIYGPNMRGGDYLYDGYNGWVTSDPEAFIFVVWPSSDSQYIYTW